MSHEAVATPAMPLADTVSVMKSNLTEMNRVAMDIDDHVDKKRKDLPIDIEDSDAELESSKATSSGGKPRKKAKTGHYAESQTATQSRVSIKKNKVVFNEKKLDLSSHPSTAADTVAFHEYKKKHPGQLSVFPPEGYPLLAKLVQDSDQTIGSLAASIQRRLCEFDEGEDSVKVDHIKKAISVISTRVNYGIVRDGQSLPNLAIWRWEVNDVALLGDVRDMVQQRRTVRNESKSALEAQIALLPEEEQEKLLATKQKKTKIPKDNAAPSTPSTTSSLAEASAADFNTVIESSVSSPAKILKEVDPVAAAQEHVSTPRSAARKSKTLTKRKSAHQGEQYDETSIFPGEIMDVDYSPAKMIKKSETKSDAKKNRTADKRKKDDQAPKGQLTLANFFGGSLKKEVNRPTPKPKDISDDVVPWAPFHRKEAVFLSPYNWFDKPVVDGFRESLFQDHYQVSKAFLKTLAPPRSKFDKDGPHSTEAQSVSDLFNANSMMEIDNSLEQIRRLPWKLLQFDEDARPAYWGTWSKKTEAVSGRRPFGKAEMLDYEYDSEAEWEPDEEGEECHSDEEDEDDSLESSSQASEEGWLVPDGHLSDDEGENLDRQPPPAEPKKRVIEALVPVIVGLYFEEADDEDQDCPSVLKECQYFTLNEKFPVDPFALDPLGADDFLDDPFNNSVKSKGKGAFTEECMKSIACIIHGNGQKLPIQIAAIQNKHPDLRLRKIAIEGKIKEIAEKERRGRDNKQKFYVKPEFEYLLADMLLTNLQSEADESAPKAPESPEQELARRLKSADSNPGACVNAIFRIMNGGELLLAEFKITPEHISLASTTKNAKLRECRAHLESENIKNDFRRSWVELLERDDFLNCVEENLANNGVGFRRVVIETCKLLRVLLGSKDPVCQATAYALKQKMATVWLQSFLTGLAHFPWSAVSTECLFLLQRIGSEATLDAASGLSTILLGQMDNVPASLKKQAYDIFRAFLKNHSKLSHLDENTVNSIRRILAKAR
ncbi:hypothetical protein SeMB42_g07710 [Synchytrium endobioticum]|uniref:Chromatin assembly factor 1 subunit A dimerization domain-containing protein n=1 Tax=Synchytrium endobioticum TaxID=286115 RepID=A0A507BNY5_9FUNG|nr:hypothetical protein SeMB42_g07710 [Synchytrium endobioticum]